MSSPNKTVAFVEHAQELKWFAQRREPTEEYTIVGLTPEVDRVARTLGLPYEPIESFYSDEELIARGIENFARVNDFCDELDQRLARRIRWIEEDRLFSTHDCFYWLKFLLDSVLNRTVMLEEALRALKPGRVLCPAPVSEPLHPDLLFRSESLVGRLAPILQKTFGYALERLSPSSMTVSKRSFWGNRHRWKQGFVRAMLGTTAGAKAAYGARQLAEVGVASFGTFRRSDRPTLVVAQYGKDVRHVARCWRHQGGGNVMVWDPRTWTVWPTTAQSGDADRTQLQEEARGLWEEIHQDEGFRSFFTFGETATFPVAERRIAYFVTQLIPTLINLTLVFAERLRRVRPAVVLATPAVGLEQGALLAAARHLGVPRVIYQHGGNYGYMDIPIVESHEFHLADFFMCYGPGVAQFHSTPSKSAHKPQRRKRAALVPVGSPVLETLLRTVRKGHGLPSRRSSPVQRRVVYVVTNFCGDRRHFNYHSYPDIWYSRLQQRVLQLCCGVPQVQIQVKLHPDQNMHNPLIELVEDRKWHNCTVIREGRFTDTLRWGDLFIVDFPSTSLLEALTTDKTVVAFGDRRFLRLGPEAVELLQRRALFSETPQQFLRDIHTALAAPGRVPTGPLNDEFLTAYGTCSDDGRSAQRAVQELMNLVDGNRVGVGGA